MFSTFRAIKFECKKTTTMGTKRRNKIIRVFVSSTFCDMRAERDYLHEHAFKKLNEYCQHVGWQFQAIDLRWGIRQEMAYRQQTMNVCLSEIKRCQEMSPKPNFIALIGNYYGWRPIPTTINKVIADRCAEDMPNDIRSIFKNWYSFVDENQLNIDGVVEPVYCLRERENLYRYNPEKYFDEVEKPLSTFFASWAQLHLPDPSKDECLFEAALTRLKMERSATEQEIFEGIIKNANAKGNACIFLKEEDEQVLRKMNENDMHNLSEIRGLLRERYTDSCFSYSNVHSLSEKVYEQMLPIIQDEIYLNPEIDEDAINTSYGNERMHYFFGRGEELNAIKIHLKESKRPVIVFGKGGIGKTTFLTKLFADLAKDSQNRFVLSRYVGISEITSWTVSLLKDVLLHLSQWVAIPVTLSDDYFELITSFKSLLFRIPVDKEVYLAFDGLDQLHSGDPGINFEWIPEELPSNVKIVFSLMSEKTDYQQQVLRAKSLLFFYLEGLPEEFAKHVILDWLKQRSRTLTNVQLNELIDAYRCSDFNMLYLRIAFEQIKNIKSYEPIDLQYGLYPLIRNYLNKYLSDDGLHGKFLVRKILYSLCMAKHGLSDKEILELLADDESFWNSFHSYDYQGMVEMAVEKRWVPPVLWLSLYNDIDFYLTRRNSPGGDVITFYHREIRDVIIQLLSNYKQPSIEEVHLSLYQYFDKQTWVFSSHAINLRKCEEWPYQAIDSGNKEIAERVLTNLEFIQNKLSMGLFYSLIQDYQHFFSFYDMNKKNSKENDKENYQTYLQTVSKDKKISVPIFIHKENEAGESIVDLCMIIYDFLLRYQVDILTYLPENAYFIWQIIYNNTTNTLLKCWVKEDIERRNIRNELLLIPSDEKYTDKPEIELNFSLSGLIHDSKKVKFIDNFGFTTDDKYIFLEESFGNFYLLNAKTGAVHLHLNKLFDKEVHNFALSVDGKFGVCTCVSTNSLLYFKVSTGEILYQCVFCRPLFVGYEKKELQLIKKYNKVLPLQRLVSRIILCADNNTVLLEYLNGSVYKWDVNVNRIDWLFDNRADIENGEYRLDLRIKEYRATTHVEDFLLFRRHVAFSCLPFSFVIGFGADACLFNTEDTMQDFCDSISTMSNDFDTFVCDVYLSRNGRFCVVYLKNGYIYVYEIEKNESARLVDFQQFITSEISSFEEHFTRVVISEDGQLVVVTSQVRNYLWNLKTNEVRRIMTELTNVDRICISVDGTSLLATSSFNHLYKINILNGKPLDKEPESEIFAGYSIKNLQEKIKIGQTHLECFCKDGFVGFAENGLFYIFDNEFEMYDAPMPFSKCAGLYASVGQETYLLVSKDGIAVWMDLSKKILWKKHLSGEVREVLFFKEESELICILTDKMLYVVSAQEPDLYVKVAHRLSFLKEEYVILTLFYRNPLLLFFRNKRQILLNINFEGDKFAYNMHTKKIEKVIFDFVVRAFFIDGIRMIVENGQGVFLYFQDSGDYCFLTKKTDGIWVVNRCGRQIVWYDKRSLCCWDSETLRQVVSLSMPEGCYVNNFYDDSIVLMDNGVRKEIKIEYNSIC